MLSFLVGSGQSMDTIDELRDENTRLKITLAEVEAENSNLKGECERLADATTQLESNLLQRGTELQRLNDVERLATSTMVR